LSNNPDGPIEARGDANASHDAPPPPLPPPVERHEDGESGDSKPDGKQITKPTDKPPHPAVYVEAACAILLVLITGTYTYYASQQAGAAITAANAAKSAASAAVSTICEMQRSNLIQERVSESNRISGERSAKESLDSTINNANLDQRAWVSVGSPVVTAKATEPFAAKFFVINVGKTPAVNVKANLGTAELPKDRPLKITDITYIDKPSDLGSMFPGAVTDIGRKGWDTVPPGQQAEVDLLKRGDHIVYIFAFITYKDVFGKSHFTHSCMRLHPDLTTAESCKIYEDSDDEQRVRTPPKSSPPASLPEIAPAPCPTPKNE